MSYNPGAHYGSAERRSWKEIPLTDVSGIIAEEEPTNPKTNVDGDSRRYAQINEPLNTPIAISGMIIDDEIATLSGINSDIRNATLSGQVNPAFATIIEEDGNLLWIAEAAPGSARGSSVWRVKQTEKINQGYYTGNNVTWADGDGNFDNTATYPLSSLF
jgi:hypothetical protein